MEVEDYKLTTSTGRTQNFIIIFFANGDEAKKIDLRSAEIITYVHGIYLHVN